MEIDTKTLFAPKKGKQATKGQKQTYEDNKETLKFYSIFATTPFLIRWLLMWILAYSFSTTEILLTVFAIICQTIAIGAMYKMAKPVLSGQTVVDCGTDLNLEGGFADYLKDLIITTSILTGLTAVLPYWLFILWLWLPIRIIVKIWNSVVAPWIFEPAPEEPEISDKKRKKMDRKMARGFR